MKLDLMALDSFSSLIIFKDNLELNNTRIFLDKN